MKIIHETNLQWNQVFIVTSFYTVPMHVDYINLLDVHVFLPIRISMHLKKKYIYILYLYINIYKISGLWTLRGTQYTQNPSQECNMLKISFLHIPAFIQNDSIFSHGASQLFSQFSWVMNVMERRKIILSPFIQKKTWQKFWATQHGFKGMLRNFTHLLPTHQ